MRDTLEGFMRTLKIHALAFFALAAVAGNPAVQFAAQPAKALPPADCFRIVVDERGLVSLPSALLRAKADISSLDPDKYNLYCGGKPVPMIVVKSRTPGVWRIEFLSEGANPLCSSDVYWLKPLAEGEKPVRWVKDNRQPDDKAATVIQAAEETLRPGRGISISGGNATAFRPARISITPPDPHRLVDGASAELRLRLRRRPCGEDYGMEWKAALVLNGKALKFTEKVDGLDWFISCDIPQGDFRIPPGNPDSITISIRNESTYPEDSIEGFVAAVFSVEDAELTLIKKTTSNSDPVITIRTSKAQVGSTVKVEGLRIYFRVFSPTEGLELTTKVVRDDTILPMYFPVTCAGPYVLVSKYLTPEVEPYEIDSKKEGFPHHPDLRSAANEADYLIIAPSAFIEAVQPLAKYRALPRRDGEKFSVMVVDAREIYDQFDFGRFGPKPIKDFLEYARKNWKRPPRYVLLAADADRDTDFAAPGLTIPAYQYEAYFSGISGTDNWYATWSEDGVPEFAIGRLPARSAEELKAMIDKIIAYETASENGPWRRRISVVAGEAGYGLRLDALLERMFRHIFGGMMPRVFDLDVSYASWRSAYYYPAEEFQKHFIGSINSGALIITYVGHGVSSGLDTAYSAIDGRKYAIFEKADVAKLNCAGHSLIMFILTCDAGAFDIAGQECLAEDMLNAPNAPVAVVASSSESHPYGNGILGIEMTPSFFAQGGACGPLTLPARASLGDMMRFWKIRNIKGRGILRSVIEVAARYLVGSKQVAQRIRVDHQHLYNLLGDPALQLAWPQFDMTLATDRNNVKPGEKITLTGACDGVKKGDVTVTLECDITDSLYAAGTMPFTVKEQRERHRQSNDKVVLSQRVALADGKFSLDLEIPKIVDKTGYALKPGTYYIKAYLTSEKGDAFAVTAVTVLAPEGESPAP